MTQRPTTPREMGILLTIGQVGIEMVAPTALGYLADRAMGIVPWLTVSGAILGFVGGMIHLLVLVNRLDRSDPPDRRDDS